MLYFAEHQKLSFLTNEAICVDFLESYFFYKRSWGLWYVTNSCTSLNRVLLTNGSCHRFTDEFSNRNSPIPFSNVVDF